MYLKLDLTDKNNKTLELGDKVIFSTASDPIYGEEVTEIVGEISVCCGAFGISNRECIFISFWELCNILELAKFEDISKYIEIIDECSTCLFNSKCENQDKCR